MEISIELDTETGFLDGNGMLWNTNIEERRMNIMRDQGSTETAEELAKDIGHSVDCLVRVGLQMDSGGI